MGPVLWFPILVPALLAAALGLTRSALLARLAGVVISAVVLGTGLLLVASVLHGHVPTTGAGVLRADALTAYMVVVVGAVGLTATWGGLAPRGAVVDPHAPTYAALICLFLAAMSLAVLVSPA